MFTVALFTIVKIWKQLMYPPIHKCMKKILYMIYNIYIYNRILFSHEKEGNFVPCKNMDGPWRHYAKWNKSDRQRQIVHGITYVEPKRNSNSRNRVEKWLPGAGGEVSREWLVKGYILSAIRWIRSEDLT